MNVRDRRRRLGFDFSSSAYGVLAALVVCRHVRLFIYQHRLFLLLALRIEGAGHVRPILALISTYLVLTYLGGQDARNEPKKIPGTRFSLYMVWLPIVGADRVCCHVDFKL